MSFVDPGRVPHLPRIQLQAGPQVPARDAITPLPDPTVSKVYPHNLFLMSTVGRVPSAETRFLGFEHPTPGVFGGARMRNETESPVRPSSRILLFGDLLLISASTVGFLRLLPSATLSYLDIKRTGRPPCPLVHRRRPSSSPTLHNDHHYLTDRGFERWNLLREVH